jgi:hypothetical protein
MFFCFEPGLSARALQGSLTRTSKVCTGAPGQRQLSSAVSMIPLCAGWGKLTAKAAGLAEFGSAGGAKGLSGSLRAVLPLVDDISSTLQGGFCLGKKTLGG